MCIILGLDCDLPSPRACPNLPHRQHLVGRCTRRASNSNIGKCEHGRSRGCKTNIQIQIQGQGVQKQNFHDELYNEN